MQRFSPASVLITLFSLTCISLLAACGGNNANNVSVSQVVLSQTIISMNEGDVVTITATPEASDGTIVIADISFVSSNPAVAAVSPGGIICAGTWDSNYIVCTPHVGQAGVGTATITATTNPGNVTATATVYTHLKVDRVVMNPPASCTSMGAVANVSATVLNTSAPGCSPSAPCDITSTVGPILYSSNNNFVAAPNSDGTITATNPGTTTIFASVSNVNSVSTPYFTCSPASIVVHLTGSPSTTSVVFNALGGTLALTADVFDTKNISIQPTLTWGSSELGSVSVVAGTPGNIATVTSVAPGTASITATCGYSSCNIGLPAQYSLNVVTATMPGTDTTTVYAASTNSTMLVPINTGGNNAGTPITLPYAPNSMVASPGGAALYLGSTTALMAVSVSSGTVTAYPVPGKIIAISPDGAFLLISDSVANAVYSFDLATASLSYISAGLTTNSSAYTPDSRWNEWTTGNEFVFGLPIIGQSIYPLPYTPNYLDIAAQGGLTYITSTTSHQVDVRSTCNQGEVQSLEATAPTLIKAVPNGTGAVVADSPNLDVIATPALLIPLCPVTTPSTIAPFNLNAGDFTAQQLFVSPDSSRAWMISDLPALLSFNLATSTPTAIPYIGGATAYGGGITLDSTRIYVGASDGTVHAINVADGIDAGQIAVGLKDANSNPVNPNLVLVLP